VDVPLASRVEADATYSRLMKAGVAIPRPPRLYEWNAYCFYFADPDGNCWEIYHC
jgi:predicted lactoylglutathione lyase